MDTMPDRCGFKHTSNYPEYNAERHGVLDMVSTHTLDQSDLCSDAT